MDYDYCYGEQEFDLEIEKIEDMKKELRFLKLKAENFLKAAGVSRKKIPLKDRISIKFNGILLKVSMHQAKKNFNLVHDIVSSANLSMNDAKNFIIVATNANVQHFGWLKHFVPGGKVIEQESYISEICDQFIDNMDFFKTIIEKKKEVVLKCEEPSFEAF